jgi:hypothetical protein
VGVTLLAPATLDETLVQVARLVFEAVPADRCIIMLRDERDGELRPRVAELRDRKGEVGEIRVSRTIIEEVVAQGRSVLTSDAQHDPRFKSATMTIMGIRSVLAVPLGVGTSIFGMIYADSPLVEARFREDHLKVLSTLGSVAAIRVENARLIEEHLERERMERELSLAREIQQRFQPSAPPNVPGYEMQGISFPSYEIGGDYYDFIRRADGRYVIALGDVSGKGTSAALLMSSLHAAVHAQVASHHALVETITSVNVYLEANTPANRFVTLFYAELDPPTGALSFVNAGHNPALILHAAGPRPRSWTRAARRSASCPSPTTRRGARSSAPATCSHLLRRRDRDHRPAGRGVRPARLHDVVAQTSTRRRPASATRSRLPSRASRRARPPSTT